MRVCVETKGGGITEVNVGWEGELEEVVCVERKRE